MEGLIWRAAIFANTSFGGGNSNNKAQIEESSSSSTTNLSQQKNAFHLFCTCTIVDRNTDTVLARLDNSADPLTLHL